VDRFSWFDSAGNPEIGEKAGHVFPTTPRRSAHNRRNRNHGFTLVELKIIMAIVLTISAIAVPNVMAALDAARIARTVGD